MSYREAIFERTDSDGDQIRVMLGVGTGPDCLYLKNTNNDQETNVVRLHKTEVRELHSALGVWLSENGITAERTPEPAIHVDERVTAEDVRRIANDEINKRLHSLGADTRGVARQEVRNFLTRAIEMGADQ